ncbi:MULTISPECIES: hypothetical protein [unclassified Crossiella]|uniref:hypothetical protein n=1 Tax=unclassified Crossiella TaxID=2620835 RepID=UPI001FFEDD34|nr:MULTISPECIES: hypothetical protein [unclassified Crossiella]MCK2237161.1 hypothetical protein [Crossiella sp. S99.2]MCK2252528.1 hypothetical protein [Crossiella sp. S99.1]
MPEVITLYCLAVVKSAEVEEAEIHVDSTLCLMCALSIPEEFYDVLPPIYQDLAFRKQLAELVFSLLSGEEKAGAQ